MDEGRAGRRGGTDQFKGRNAALSGAEFAGIGVQFALTLLVFVAAGTWLDRRLGTSPWLLIVCVFAGAGGGFYSMYRKVTAAQRRDADRIAADKASRRGEGQP
jgi:F0F1-type ATP synthase assembly protein I